jgi:hypothetical protein
LAHVYLDRKVEKTYNWNVTDVDKLIKTEYNLECCVSSHNNCIEIAIAFFFCEDCYSMCSCMQHPYVIYLVCDMYASVAGLFAAGCCFLQGRFGVFTRSAKGWVLYAPNSNPPWMDRSLDVRVCARIQVLAGNDGARGVVSCVCACPCSSSSKGRRR